MLHALLLVIAFDVAPFFHRGDHDDCASAKMSDGMACRQAGGSEGICRKVDERFGPFGGAPSDARCNERLCLMCVDKRTTYKIAKVIETAKKQLKAGNAKAAAATLDTVVGAEPAEECLRRYTAARAAARLGDAKKALELNDSIVDFIMNHACDLKRDQIYNSACYHSLLKQSAETRRALFLLLRALANQDADAKAWKRYQTLVSEDTDLAGVRPEAWFKKVTTRFDEGLKSSTAHDVRGICVVDDEAWFNEGEERPRGPCKVTERGRCTEQFRKVLVPKSQKVDFSKCALDGGNDEL